ncbi:MAG TPA: FAD-dependent oxidoreductase [Bacteroidetes bacterium]|nr:FAD-dependent oxidoreductase [Bacteroidota bacterium]
MPPPWYNSKIIKIEDQAPGTRRFWVEIEGVDHFEFKPGQFVTMDLPTGEKRKDRWRSYSIANAPDGSAVLEFCIVYLEKGRASEFFFNEAHVGTPLRFRGPAGKFVLPEKLDKELVFICTGTGVAPFRSMLLDLRNRGQLEHRIHLIFGTRYREGVLYHEEFVQLMKQTPCFQYDVTLSREKNLNGSFPFRVHRGYVHPVYLEKYADKNPNRLFYICGWRVMIDEAVDNLVNKLGYDRKQVVYELYG